jgi:hypothetical protein
MDTATGFISENLLVDLANAENDVAGGFSPSLTITIPITERVAFGVGVYAGACFALDEIFTWAGCPGARYF